MLENIAFGIIAAVMVISGFRVVTTRNLVHSVLWLGLMLGGTAAAFVQLRAPFMGAIQLLLYAGGVLTLMLFGIMLTRREHDLKVPNEQNNKAKGALIAGGLFVIMVAAILKTEGIADAPVVAAVDTQALGESFLTTHLLAFEVLSILLLAAVIGAIVLARGRDATDEVEGPVVPARRPVAPPGADS